MSKVRVNELARELEVKPGVILELLPELGVHEKKTHSSSLDEDVALELRRRLGGTGGPGAGASDDAGSSPQTDRNGEPVPHVVSSAPVAPPSHETAEPPRAPRPGYTY
jgi:translation initiation factor IF-2